VARTGRPARIDYADASGHAADTAREWGFSTGVGAPINVEDRLWGVMSVGTAGDEPPPAATESRLVGFTELVGTALANAEARAALTASRARIVAAADMARRRIERDLHDGAQQHLVSLALHLRAAHAAVPPEAGELAVELRSVADGLASVLEELRELARDIHPAALANGGLGSALRTLANRSAIPVRLDFQVDGRLPEQVDLTAYYVVAEALANAAKHAHASAVTVRVTADTGALRVVVSDNGRGGADLTLGSGLLGLVDRIEALGGRLLRRRAGGAAPGRRTRGPGGTARRGLHRRHRRSGAAARRQRGRAVPLRRR
jgi:signal transduction histidine kinase